VGGLGCGWAKLNVVFRVGKGVGKTPLLILRSVGIFFLFSVSLLSVVSVF
jgi:hypothetical protein